jgi:hypothetical protein
MERYVERRVKVVQGRSRAARKKNKAVEGEDDQYETSDKQIYELT